MSVENGFLQINGAQIYYEQAGAGDCIILIHGFALDTRTWDRQFDVFAEHYRVVRYDLRGFGKSDLPTGPYSTLDDLQVMMDQLGIEKATLVGISLGGSLAIEFALTYPERVAGLVLAGSTLRGYPFSDAYITAFLSCRKTARFQGLDAVREELANCPLIATIARQSANFAPVKTMIKDYSCFHLLNHDPHKVFHPPAMTRLSEVACPVQILVGQEDVQDIRATAELLEREIKQARLAEIPNVGHIVNLEAPKQFNDIVLDFVRTRDAHAATCSDSAA